MKIVKSIVSKKYTIFTESFILYFFAVPSNESELSIAKAFVVATSISAFLRFNFQSLTFVGYQEV